MSERTENPNAESTPARASIAECDAESSSQTAHGSARRAYEAPRLLRLGRVQDLTLGKSSGRRADVVTRVKP